MSKCSQEIRTFRRSCHAAKIPEIKARLSLRDVLEWCLNAIPRPRKMSYNFPDGTSVSVDLFGNSREDQTNDENAKPALPRYIHQVKENLEAILESSGLHLWFLIDRLDEIFPLVRCEPPLLPDASLHIPRCLHVLISGRCAGMTTRAGTRLVAQWEPPSTRACRLLQ